VKLLTVLIGWPAVIVSLVLAALGVHRRQWQFLAAAAIFALPILLYLSGTPRFSLAAVAVGLSSLASVVAAYFGHRRLSAILFLPFLALAVFLAAIVANQHAV
jgi:hypothetical protein